MPSLALKLLITPLLIAAASLAGRRWGHHVGGWLVAMPLTSGPVAFFLATDHGIPFAAHATVGMLAGTASQVAFALTYRATSRRGWLPPLLAAPRRSPSSPSSPTAPTAPPPPQSSTA
jgi:hypothetical protein